MSLISISGKQCVLVGEGSILTHCAEQLLAHDFTILAIASGDPHCLQWAQAHDVAALSWHESSAIEQLLKPFAHDILLSIGNLYIVPSSLVERPNTLAINIHDGPMPELLGFNTTMWSILANRDQHQVNWHLMTGAVYSGDLLATESVSIESNETAMSLNTKCFTAAMRGFEHILHQLNIGQVKAHPQVLVDGHTSEYFSLVKRPHNFGILNPQLASVDAICLTHGLDTGHYDNPLTRAKIIVQEQVLIIGDAEIMPAVTDKQVGEIVNAADNYLTVVWSDGCLRLQVLHKANGTLINAAELDNFVGQSLNNFNDKKPSLTALASHFGKHEQWWAAQIAQFEPITVPYIEAAAQKGRPELQSHSLDFLPDQDWRANLAVVALYFSRLADQAHFACPLIFGDAYAGPSTSQGLAAYLGSERQCINFAFHWHTSFNQQLAEFKTYIDRLSKAGAFAIDLIDRKPNLQGFRTLVDQPFALFISDEDDQTLRNNYACFSTLPLVIVASPGASTSNSPQLRLISFGGLMKPLERIANEIHSFYQRLQSDNNQKIANINLVDEIDQQQLHQWGRGPEAVVDTLLFDRLYQSIDQAQDGVAVYHRDQTLTFNQLNELTSDVAQALQQRGVTAGDFVGVMMPRCLELLPALLGIMSIGAACVPMDPNYPKDRLEYVIGDAQLDIILCLEPVSSIQSKAQQVPWSELIHKSVTRQSGEQIKRQGTQVKANQLAYMLYTSGSSGNPKGVMVEHGNLANFFLAMDQKIPTDQASVWLAVTSISFDISLLELLWTLSCAVPVVLYDGQDINSPQQAQEQLNPVSTHKPNEHQSQSLRLDFSLFYWNIANEHDVPGPHHYELLLEGSKYGDQNGFTAVWTPERHFGDFGGLYPNPAVTSAAVAAVTKRIGIRAGSCVFPLHHPVRIAEDWAVVDNISNGRVGLSAAPGWMPDDFVIMPQNHADAKAKMFEGVATVKQLWRGEAVEFPGPKGPVKVKTLPRPVQKELPIWITTGGNPDNFKHAGSMGANLLTHLLGQTIEELALKITLYQQAWQAAGHPGKGHITVMLHTCVAQTDEQAKDLAREPMKNYLKTALFLVKAAAWDWPLFKQMSESQGQNLDEFFDTISDEDMDALLEFSFERYFKTAGLFGSPERCVAFADTLYQAGVSEIGCLIDYGIENSTVLKHLPLIKQVMDETNRADRQVTQKPSVPVAHHSTSLAQWGVAALIKRHHVTHLQVTPSMARLFLSDEAIVESLNQLETVLVGGEALPLDLAKTLKAKISGPLLNMYGPTETTIWSSVDVMNAIPEQIALGRPIVNTQISIVDSRKQPMPVGAIGELMIGGAGVVRGYWQRTELTDEKFLTGFKALTTAKKVYSTGDLARFLPDGRLIFLGRNDFQVKVRGYRIELGEIETLLLKQPGIQEAVVQPVVYAGAEPRLVAYYSLKPQAKAQHKALKAALAETLPPFMVPNVFVELESFPLTPNAKVDRKALPLPRTAQDNEANKALLSSASDLEVKVLNIWRDILGLDTLGLDDHFFDNGGHSLLVVDVMTRVKPLFEKPIKLIDLFRYPKVRELVKHLSSDSKAGEQAKIETATSRGAARRAARKR